MATLSAADILKSKEFFEADEKTKRYIHHKFQDFGYRLAEKLGDLEHRAIYMRLAKNEDKGLLQRALQFALDYRDEPNKGRIFMWRLSKLKEELALKQAKTNFNHDFVMDKMSDTYDALARNIYTKQKARLDTDREQILNEFASVLPQVNTSSRATTKLLDLGINAGVDAHILSRHPVKIYGFDISRKLVNIAKKHCKDASAIRKKHFLENTYDDEYFHGVWMDKFWQIVPKEAEQEYFVELYRILANKGRLAITFRPTQEPQQFWQEINWQDDTLLSLFKSCQQQQVIQMAEKIGFKFEKEFVSNQVTVFFRR